MKAKATNKISLLRNCRTICHLLCFLMCILLLCSGCTPIESMPEPTISPMPTATPVPTPSLWDGDALCAAFSQLWEEYPAPTLGEYLPDNVFAQEGRWQIFGTKEQDRAWLPIMAADIATQLKQALESAVDELAAHPQAPTFTFAAQLDAPSWQLLLSLLQASSSPDEASGYIKAAMALSTQVREQADGSYELVAKLSPLPYKEALALPGGGSEGVMQRSFSYSYARTVFADDASEYEEYVQPPAEGNLANGIVWPLSDHTRLRKTWYADRSGGIRKHTGTDIWAAADTEIYSCTDGIISYIGYSEGTGYAVIVTDEFGYEFHYYHMIRQPDFIKEGDPVHTGDLIGHVGNTGNSDLDHLHLTIVASDGLYVNPYPYLKAIEP